MNKKKNIIIISVIIGIVLLLGITFAWFNYYQEGSNHKMIMSDLYLNLDDGNDEIVITNVYPLSTSEARARNDNYKDFTISGKNTSNQDIYYEIKIIHGNEVNNLDRINDEDLVFDLVEIGQNNEETYIVDAKSYSDINDKRIWVETVNKGTTTEITKTYRLRVWVRDDILISDTDPNRTYCATDNCVTGEKSFNNHFASVKIAVFGDFQEKDLPGAYNMLKKNADTTTQINFGNISSDTNGKGLYLLKGTESDTNPIYYYRGEVNNNNVVFGDFCWQMVRTTDTGGIKMIYNGLATKNGTAYECNGTSPEKGINGAWGTDSVSVTAATSFGRTFSYDLDAGTFTIEDIVKENSTNLIWSDFTADKLVGTYTCNSSATTCGTLYYVGYYVSSTNASVESFTIGALEHFSIIGKSVFNTYNTSQSLVGYMYNKVYYYTRKTPSSGVYFGNGVSYDDTTGMYTLTGTDVTTAPDSSHHYSCNLTNASGSCITVRYYYSNGSFIELTGGEKIEDAIYKMTGNGDTEIKSQTINQNYELNKVDSPIKSQIERWFKKNLTNEEESNKINYQVYLEDTIYCNDRSYQTSGNETLLKSGWNSNADNIAGNGDLNTGLYFNSRAKWNNLNWYSTINKPTFTCSNETDSFSVSNEKAKLKYPVGLLTVDEIILAGAAGNAAASNNKYYLYTGNPYWGLSPSTIDYGNCSNFYLSGGGYVTVNGVYTNLGIRPVVSLKSGIEFEDDGDGTPTNPYVVKYN